MEKYSIYPNWYSIASKSINGVIGNGAYMPWDVPGDLKWFRTKTYGKNVLMGRKTFETVKFLNDKCNYIVLTNAASQFKAENVNYYRDIDLIKNKYGKDELWISGGEEVYSQLLNNCAGLYLSTIKEFYNGDHYFPDYSNFELNKVLYENDIFKIEFYVNKGAGKNE